MRTIKDGVADKLGIKYEPNIKMMMLQGGYSLEYIDPRLVNYLNAVRNSRGERELDWDDELSKKCL